MWYKLIIGAIIIINGYDASVKREIIKKEGFMKKANLDIRTKAKECGVYLWQIADAIGIQESRFCKLMRSELPLDEKQKILAAIEELAKEGC